MNKKILNFLHTLMGWTIIFGLSGLIYGLLNHPILIGVTSIILSIILALIVVLSRDKRTSSITSRSKI